MSLMPYKGSIRALVDSSIKISCLNGSDLGTFFAPIHCSYFFCVRRTDGAARFIFFFSLSLSERVTLWSRIIPVHVRERGKEKERRRKKPRKKPLCRGRDSNPQTLSPEPSMLSIRPLRPAQPGYLSG